MLNDEKTTLDIFATAVLALLSDAELAKLLRRLRIA
jgi:hypothetical protein